MSYQVLARKWRPRNFSALVGQEHVVQALSHALEQQRLHHAWLFTGTRGVGKTTLARILAKCLNCAQGITSAPCGECQACIEIDAGRFVDYIELDAASNRRVEEMTQLLEQAVYAPSSGRFKVYTIDEVHMLTGHAFNAMLKTLEEPPAHVKFILATTDPQKIPATVLSRCLQFNLKQISVPVIADHLADILAQEHIAFEPAALNALGQAAAGSMRDALSLTDQAIAYSAQDIRLEAVQAMLGSIDSSYLESLMTALCSQDAQGLLALADRMHQQGLSFAQTLSDWAELLSQVATVQRAPNFADPNLPYHHALTQWAQQLPPDLLQLYYTVAIHSRHELHLAPTEYTGFVMACLRMLALSENQPLVTVPTAATPMGQSTNPPTQQPVPPPTAAPQPAQASAAQQPTKAPEPPTPSAENSATFGPILMTGGKNQPTQTQQLKPIAVSTERSTSTAPAPVVNTTVTPEEQPVASVVDYFVDEQDETIEDSLTLPASLLQAEVGAMPKAPAFKLGSMDAARWSELSAQLPLTGWAAQIARRSEWIEQQGNEICLRLELRSVDDMQAKTKLNTVLNEYFGQVVRLKIEYGHTGAQTAHAKEQAHLQALQQQAEDSAARDPFIQTLKERFGAQIVKGSILAHAR